MAKKKNSEIPKTEKQRLEEIRQLSENVKKITAEPQTLFDYNVLGEEDLDTEFDGNILNDTANPDESWRTYYTMMAALKRNLPRDPDKAKDAEYKILRRHVYDEKSLFLNRGKVKDARGIKGSDERQAYIGNFLQIALNTVKKWVESGGTPFDIYKAFYDLNVERGYRTSSEQTEPLSDFNNKLNTALNYNPKDKGKQ